MVKGLYTGYTGMVNEQKRLDVIANNLANSATTGYKREGMVNQSFDHELAIRIRPIMTCRSASAPLVWASRLARRIPTGIRVRSR